MIEIVVSVVFAVCFGVIIMAVQAINGDWL